MKTEASAKPATAAKADATGKAETPTAAAPSAKYTGKYAVDADGKKVTVARTDTAARADGGAKTDAAAKPAAAGATAAPSVKYTGKYATGADGKRAVSASGTGTATGTASGTTATAAKPAAPSANAPSAKYTGKYADGARSAATPVARVTPAAPRVGVAANGPAPTPVNVAPPRVEKYATRTDANTDNKITFSNGGFTSVGINPALPVPEVKGGMDSTSMLMVASRVSGSTVETGNTASSQTAKDKKVNGSQNSYESPEATNLTTTLNVLAIP